MNILDEEQKKWSNVVNDALCHCRHILELDFLRDDVVHKNDYNEPIYAYMYAIKEEIAKTNKKDRDTLTKLSHLLFYKYDENPVYIQEKPSVIYNCSLINVVKTSLFIPKFFTDKSYRELTVLMNVEDALKCMKSNVKHIILNQMKNLHKCILMVHVYASILKELKVSMLNFDEMKIVDELQGELDVIFQFYHKELETLKLVNENSMIKDLEQEQEKTSRILDRLDYIIVNAQEMNIDNISGEYSVSQINGKTLIRSNTPHTLLDLYSKLSLLNYDIKLIVHEDEKDGMKKSGGNHIISGSSSVWAFVFNKLYGDNSKYTVERDNEVKNIIKLSEKLKVPVDYMFTMKND
tara:strand:+ start:107 stop:1156 length:1050 start_codon:yes stop_codon:yes gene_type:complete